MAHPESSPPPAASAWWREAVFYQVYPRSFQDSDGDGIGDLPGLCARLDHLQALGVDALWLSPIQPSPGRDFGYDVSCHTGVAPELGTLDDFRRLVDEAHRRGMRVVLDLVLNHTSDLHPWFLEAAAGRASSRRDWYHWHPGRRGWLGRRPPNNWGSVFGGSMWQWHPASGEYYLHTFLPEQPDLAWRNPAVQAAMTEVARFWLEQGVDGFRLDAVNCLFKDPALRDNPPRPIPLRRYERQHHLHDRDRPETVAWLCELRRSLAELGEPVLIGEVLTDPPGDAEIVARHYANGAGLHLAFSFELLFAPWRAARMARAIAAAERTLPDPLWPCWALNNHDQARSSARYRAYGDKEQRLRVAAALLLTLRGTPFLYYGEEIGLPQVKLPRRRLRDPLGRRYWPLYLGRDGARTPMAWDRRANAGFTSAQPWLPLHPDWPERNVASQRGRADSLLHWYRALLALRRREPVLRRGSCSQLAHDHKVVRFERRLPDRRVLVLLNFTARRRRVVLPADGRWHALLSSPPELCDGRLSGGLDLPPHGVLLAASNT